MYIQFPYDIKASSTHVKTLRFPVFKLRILVNQITKRDVVEIVLSANEDVEFLVQYRELTTADQTAKI